MTGSHCLKTKILLHHMFDTSDYRAYKDLGRQLLKQRISLCCVISVIGPTVLTTCQLLENYFAKCT